jgi:hypothetical protein
MIASGAVPGSLLKDGKLKNDRRREALWIRCVRGITVNWKSKSARTNRSAKRIPLQVPLTVTGRDEHGTTFADPVRTENVSIDGGCLLLNGDLRRNQIEGLNGARLVARVRWCMYYFRQDIRRVEFQLDTDSKESWILSKPRCLVDLFRPEMTFRNTS